MTDGSVFAAALAIPRPADRATYLEKRVLAWLRPAYSSSNRPDRPRGKLP
jgi:hypothetical protein